MMPTNSIQKGFSLIETVITIVVLGIALSAIVSVLSPGLSRSADPIWQSRAVELLEAYLDEIKAMRFDEVTPQGGGYVANCDLTNEGESRSQYDDIGDYHNLNNSPPELLQGALGADYSGYRVQITVSCVGTSFGFPDDNYIKRVSVQVTGPTGATLVSAMFKGNF